MTNAFPAMTSHPGHTGGHIIIISLSSTRWWFAFLRLPPSSTTFRTSSSELPSSPPKGPGNREGFEAAAVSSPRGGGGGGLFLSGAMNTRRDVRANRAALFDGIEEGGIRASSSYSSHEINEHENERAMDGLQDRVILLKRLSGDINEEVETHNRLLDRMGNEMDSSRGVLSGTMDRFKMVFETKSSRRMLSLVASFVVIFLVVYYLTR
ncbi:bet1-like SNARE 1-1 [Syzygium oleosum]|uniref:bet1-like SNARE 1-1 n=1 Tax=Syzygium oleosum TaxID=219896 RepID=UPI0024B8D8B5|nr:bet1-like SNARE 1-1 [Syzygium oleosum]